MLESQEPVDYAPFKGVIMAEADPDYDDIYDKDIDFVDMRDLLNANMDDLEAVTEPDAPKAVPMGILALDSMMSGLHPGSLTIIAGPTSVGKTALALEIAAGIAAKPDLKESQVTAIFSPLTPAKEISMRLLCSRARVDMSRARDGRLSENDWSKISHAVGMLADAPIHVDDTPVIDVEDIKFKASLLKQKLGQLGLIIIDYTNPVRIDSRTAFLVQSETVGDKLAGIADATGAAVVAVHQLPWPKPDGQYAPHALYELYGRYGNPIAEASITQPQYDVYASHDLAERADTVLLLRRDDLIAAPSKTERSLGIHVLKNNFGPTGFLDMGFEPSTGRITS